MGNTENTAQIGVNETERIILSMNWYFRRQLESDIGVDAQAEPVVDGEATGQIIGIQIKSGPSYFTRKRGSSYVYRGTARHLAYWERLSIPLLLVLHNPETNETVWTKVERHKATILPDGSWTIEISSYSRLTENSAQSILENLPKSDPENTRRQRMALDVDLIRRVAGGGEVAFLTIEEWINKSLNIRGAEISFDDPYAEAEYRIPFYMARASIEDALDFIFPWGDVSYSDAVENVAGEIDLHKFEMTVNELGKAFLLLEDFYRDGPQSRDELTPPPDESEAWFPDDPD
ncbi:DUF4365 domain-containing protein [Mesorhizobium sp. 2RAF45]|uniref:DUF4365 domain-containing protein n=1 Tax=Mesorhizobium sp. 2RAF45 TaxID=3233001 RepID=UPI003F9871AE